MSTKPNRNVTIGDFVLNNEALFPWTVYVYVPNAAGTGKTKAKFGVEFCHVTPERRLELLQDFREKAEERKRLEEIPDGDKTDEDIEAIRQVLSFELMLLQETVARFTKGIRDPQGNDVSTDEATKAQMFSNAWARDALLYSYQQALQGRSAEGN
ncbi:MAG: hypothetical protein ABL934_09890 [Lysobacteraceae bacterium]